MKMNELIRYDIPPDILRLWREGESDILLPLQELAVKRHGLFGDDNLLIQAPTSSGKTFIGEMAAIHTALRRKKVIYLVPLKALAEEKYQDFKEKYSPYGLDVIISTRDRREFDRRLENGNFSIAVIVYEKLSQLLVRRPERLQEVALVIADELEILSDPDRGALVEILLTRILQSDTRLVGLSAVIGHAHELAEWMEAHLISYERRPVELRYGVLHEGEFRYRTYNERGEGQEPMLGAHSDSAWEILTENVCEFASKGEPCLIFAKARQESRRGAELLSRRLELPAARETIAALEKLESTFCREALLNTLNVGVAFHSADLSPDERRVVEQGFRAGEIKVIVSTSTLALGMNLPARNVFISADKWRYDNRLGMPWKSPILRAEHDNMGGRAGRFGAGHEFGRAILIATTPFEYETLWRRYIESECEPIEPRLAKGPLEDYVLGLIASRYCRSDEELHQFLESTLSGRWIWRETLTAEETAFRVRTATNRAMDAGVLTKHPDGRIEATPLGLAAAAKGISIASTLEIEHWIAESETRLWGDLDLILAAGMTPDGRMLQVSLTSQEYEHADYVGMLKRITEREDISADVPLNRLRNCLQMPFFEEVRAVKAALFLSEWVDHASLRDLEERYHTTAGQILAAADQVSWLVDATAALAMALGAPQSFIERIRTLSERIQRGLRAEALPLARLGLPALNRNMLAMLVGRGLFAPETLAETPIETLTNWMPVVEARRLKEWAVRSIEKTAEEASRVEIPPARVPVLVVDDRKPGEITLDGVKIRLQEKQYRLIHVLASWPGECVPYDTIYERIWGDVIVEPNQMHFQKRKALDCIAEAVPNRTDLITTIPKRGFVLNLAPDEVLLHAAPVSTAA